VPPDLLEERVPEDDVPRPRSCPRRANGMRLTCAGPCPPNGPQEAGVRLNRWLAHADIWRAQVAGHLLPMA